MDHRNRIKKVKTQRMKYSHKLWRSEAKFRFREREREKGLALAWRWEERDLVHDCVCVSLCLCVKRKRAVLPHDICTGNEGPVYL